MEVIVSITMGIALAASCGFRVFTPLLIAGLAIRFGYVQPSGVPEWVSSDAALICLGVATIVEMAAYYIPYVDNLLDTISTPLALTAGTLVMGTQLDALPNIVQWGLAIIAGAGTAGTVQASTATIRATSTATTGGLGNFLVATGENILATIGAFLAVIVPIIACIGLVILLIPGVIFLRRILNRRKKTNIQPA